MKCSVSFFIHVMEKNVASIWRGWILVFVCLMTTNVHALQSFEGKIVLIEPSYLPGTVSFVMDAGDTTCSAGRWLFWSNADPSNNKAVYASLFGAMLSGKTVRFIYNDGDVNCTPNHLHILN